MFNKLLKLRGDFSDDFDALVLLIHNKIELLLFVFFLGIVADQVQKVFHHLNVDKFFDFTVRDCDQLACFL